MDLKIAAIMEHRKIIRFVAFPAHKSWGKHHKNIYGHEMSWKLLINCNSSFPKEGKY